MGKFKETRSNLHPLRWSLICWLLFLLWFSASVLVNWPHLELVENLPIDSAKPFAMPDGSRAVAYDLELVSVRAGLPFTFQEITKTTNTYRLLPHLANIAIAVVNLLALIYSAQAFFGRFNIRIIFCLVTLVALLIAIGQIVFSIERGQGELMFIVAIFFSPLFAVVPAFLLNYYRCK